MTNKQGWLNKKAHMRHKWGKRWFVLSEGVLRYFPDPSPGKPLGTEDMKNVLGMRKTEYGIKTNCFYIQTKKRTYYLQCESEKECDVWLDVLGRAVLSARHEGGTHAFLSTFDLHGTLSELFKTPLEDLTSDKDIPRLASKVKLFDDTNKEIFFYPVGDYLGYKETLYLLTAIFHHAQLIYDVENYAIVKLRALQDAFKQLGESSSVPK